ncbi:MAG: alanine--tRNA ligase, partial [Bacteroidales bacterium]|nr:alanine--tRNA ligase [Bacteroidales bacterium]
ELIATEKGYSVDLEGFQAELAKQKERARAASSNEFGDWTEFRAGEEVSFLGYDCTRVEGAVLLKQRTVKQKNKTLYQLVFDRTPFYAEMGGQVGDTGFIASEGGEKIAILNTVKENNLTIHIAERLPEDGTKPFTLAVDAERRLRITNNHTATHLMDTALREVLGTHVEQKGSFVGPDYFRFDFSHFSKMTDEEIAAVERRVNQLIRANYPICEKRDATMEEANAMGALALFGEKYGDRVRVVNFGPSTELCGGTHAAATGQIGFFKIVSEGAVAAGVRRIEAVTGETAEKIVYALQETVRSARSFFNNAPDLTAAIEKVVTENTAFKKEIDGFLAEKAEQLSRTLTAEAREIGGYKVITLDRSMDPAMVRNVALLLQKELRGFIFAGAYLYDGKPNLALMYTADLVEAGKNAGKDIREAAKLIQGGGGQPGLATAGGKNPDGLQAALEKLIEVATA